MQGVRRRSFRRQILDNLHNKNLVRRRRSCIRTGSLSASYRNHNHLCRCHNFRKSNLGMITILSQVKDKKEHTVEFMEYRRTRVLKPLSIIVESGFHSLDSYAK